MMSTKSGIVSLNLESEEKSKSDVDHTALVRKHQSSNHDAKEFSNGNCISLFTSEIEKTDISKSEVLFSRGNGDRFEFRSEFLFQEPLLLKYTEYFTGKTNDILMFTADIVTSIVQNISNTPQRMVIRKLLSSSKKYSGRPIYIVFDPKNALQSSENKKTPGQTSIPLHSSPGNHNLLSEECVHDIAVIPVSNQNIFNNSNSNDSVEISKKYQTINLSDFPSESHNGGDLQLLISSAEQNSFQSSNQCAEPISGRKKLLIKHCKRKKSRTALKRVNVKQIVTSAFKNFFHFYALVGGHLKSGSVITKSNSNYWLREAGVATDPYSLEVADELFTAIAGAKIVLNIFDYLQFLVSFARLKQVSVPELISQLTICELPALSIKETKRRKSRKRNTQGSHERFQLEELGDTYCRVRRRSRSLPKEL